MSLHPKTNSNQRLRSGTHWMGWTLAVLAVPVVYVLTLPPAILMVIKVGGPTMRLPKWLNAYGAPYDWLIQETSLGEPLMKYGSWWTTQIPPFSYPSVAIPLTTPLPTTAP